MSDLGCHNALPIYLIPVTLVPIMMVVRYVRYKCSVCGQTWMRSVIDGGFGYWQSCPWCAGVGRMVSMPEGCMVVADLEEGK